MKKSNQDDRYSEYRNNFGVKFRFGSGFRRSISWIIFIAILNIMTGCANFFKVTRTGEPLAEKAISFGKQGKDIIYHQENKAWHMDSLNVSENKLTGIVTNEYFSIYKKPVKQKKPNLYKRKSQSALLTEVHIYGTASTQFSGSRLSIPLPAIQKIDVYEKDRTATTWSHIIGYSAFPLFVLTFEILEAIDNNGNQ